MSEVYEVFLGYTEPMPAKVPEFAEETDISEPDMVNHPPHYQSESGLEVIDVIDAFLDWKSVYAGNILKYTLRYKNKNGHEDLKKAQWYLNRMITKMEKETKE